jgi:hypothetical protein
MTAICVFEHTQERHPGFHHLCIYIYRWNWINVCGVLLLVAVQVRVLTLGCDQDVGQLTDLCQSSLNAVS